MKDALDIHRTLLEYEIEHQIVRLRRLIFMADDLPGVLSLPRRRCLATRPYRAGSRLLAFVVEAGETPTQAAALAAAGVQDARPAPPDLVNRVTDYAAGLVAPLLLPDHVQLFIDRHIVETMDADDVVYTPTGDSGTALGIRLYDLLKLNGAMAADLATRVVQAPDLPGAVRPTTQPPGVIAGGRRR